uniref:P-type Ca(2+) transporter n=1 Tax=Zea mays TaxID=4577 RepID=A0A804QAS6_MAIZE
MGISGTEVAKESSDIIILDDDFTSVVKVVRWGRSVYGNIQKFIEFQLTVNVAALVINVVAVVSSGDVPLNVVELLWVNLIMDTLGALALATEPPTDNLMKRNPVGRREPLVTNIIRRNLFVQALYQVAILLIFNFDGVRILRLQNESRSDAEKIKNTFIFNTFVFCQQAAVLLGEQPVYHAIQRTIGCGVAMPPVALSSKEGVNVVLEVEVLDEVGKPAGGSEAQHGRRHDRGPLNSRREDRSIGDGKEPDDGGRGHLQGSLERLHGLERCVAAPALHHHPVTQTYGTLGLTGLELCTSLDVSISPSQVVGLADWWWWMEMGDANGHRHTAQGGGRLGDADKASKKRKTAIQAFGKRSATTLAESTYVGYRLNKKSKVKKATKDDIFSSSSLVDWDHLTSNSEDEEE